MQFSKKFLSVREFSKITAQDRRDRYAAIIDRGYRAQREWTAEALVDKLGYNVGLFRRRMQHGDTLSFPIHDLPIITEVCGTELIETVTQDCGGVFVLAPDAAEKIANPATATLTLSKRLGDLAAEIAVATSEHSKAGKDISPCEAREIRKKIRELQQDAAALDLVMKGLEAREEQP